MEEVLKEGKIGGGGRMRRILLGRNDSDLNYGEENGGGKE